MARSNWPVNYTELLAHRICEQLATGNLLIDICAQEGYPPIAKVLKWAADPDENKRPGFAAKFRAAREIGWEIMGEQTIRIADDSARDKIIKTIGGVEIEVVNTEAIQRDALRIKSRQWFLSKRMAALYGDKVQMEVSGSIDLVARLAAAKERVMSMPREIVNQIAAEAIAELPVIKDDEA